MQQSFMKGRLKAMKKSNIKVTDIINIVLIVLIGFMAFSPIGSISLGGVSEHLSTVRVRDMVTLGALLYLIIKNTAHKNES